MEIIIEKRNCKGCGRVFKVMESSPQTHCSRNCIMLGQEWDGQKNLLKNDDRKTETVNVSNIKKNYDERKDLLNYVEARQASWPLKGVESGKRSEKNIKPSTVFLHTQLSEIETPKSLEKKSERRREGKEPEEETKSMSNSVKTIETTQMEHSSNESADTEGSQIETFELPIENMKKEFLDSMSILSESAKQLNEQNRSLLKSTEYRQPGHENIILARHNAETIAKLVQTKINFVKALR